MSVKEEKIIKQEQIINSRIFPLFQPKMQVILRKREFENVILMQATLPLLTADDFVE